MESDLRVLVLEDHGFQRRMLLHLLRDLGLRADHLLDAADAEAALDLLAVQATPPDLLLVDLDMPGMDGIEFLGHVAERGLARNVALVSALEPALLHAVEIMARAYGLDILGVIEKPVTRDGLAALLDVDRIHARKTPATADADVDEQALAGALARGDIRPWFQLQVDMTNGKPRAVEALARWADGDRVRLPAQFLPALERLGQMPRLTDAMLDQACAWRTRWAREHAIDLCVAVNVAPSDLSDAGIADRFERIVAQHGVAPSEVVLEITEGSLLSDLACGLRVLARLRLKGFGLSIDDFGVGYSSLAQLSQIPFTELKIDRGFVDGAGVHARKRAVIESSLDLGRKLRLTTVAEGIETQAQWQLMAQLGCGLAQGHLIARPVPGEALPDALAHWRRPD